MKQSILITSGAIDDVLQWRYDGKTLQEISELLWTKKGIKMAYQSIWSVLKTLEKQNQKKEDAQDILYKNRKDILKLKREKFYTNAAIALKYGVNEKEVEEFLSKRKKLSGDDYRDILYKSSKGISANDIADEYGVNIKTIESILSKNKVISPSPIVTSKYLKEKENLINQSYDPEIIKNFSNFITLLQVKYKEALEELDNCNKTRNDMYHQIEMSALTQEESLKILSKIQNISLERRELKDFVELLEPLVSFLDVPENKRVLLSLCNIGEKIMSQKEKLKNRVYFIKGE